MFGGDALMKGHANDATRASTSVPVDTASASGSDFNELLPRLTKKVFLGIWMTGLGLLMGIVFPFFVMTFGVPSGYVLSARCLAATIGAGLVVGATNQLLSRTRGRRNVAAPADDWSDTLSHRVRRPGSADASDCRAPPPGRQIPHGPAGSFPRVGPDRVAAHDRRRPRTRLRRTDHGVR